MGDEAEDDKRAPRRSGDEARLQYFEPDSPHRWAHLGIICRITNRELSLNNNIFKACTGISQSVSGSNVKLFILGLPESNFVEGLQWPAFTYCTNARRGFPNTKNYLVPGHRSKHP